MQKLRKNEPGLLKRNQTTAPAACQANNGAISQCAFSVLKQLLSRDHDLHLTWQTDSCRVIADGGNETVAIPLARSVFRAMLARLAALCTSTTGELLSPYGGAGTYHFESNPSIVIHVEFTNTADILRLSLNPEPIESADSGIIETAIAG